MVVQRGRLELGRARVLVTTERLYVRKIAGIRGSLPRLEHVFLVSENMKLEIAVLIDNSNTYNIKVKKSSLDIYLNGKYAGKTTLDEKVVIKKKSENVYYVVVNVSTKDLMKAAMGNIGGLLKGTAKVQLKGKVKGAVYGISKSVDVDMEQEVNLKDFMP